MAVTTEIITGTRRKKRDGFRMPLVYGNALSIAPGMPLVISVA
jgi:hypothetical protein